MTKRSKTYVMTGAGGASEMMPNVAQVTRNSRALAAQRRHWLAAGISLAALTSGAGADAAGSSSALPSGGAVSAGTATISGKGSTLTVNQASSRAVINWNSFKVGQGGLVQFNNGSGATLNRVTGPGGSRIDGTISATGSVFLLDPSGVIVSSTGRISVGGDFVASSLSTSDRAFMAGGPLQLTGASGIVLNLGRISSAGGDIVLAAPTVGNSGDLIAPRGEVALLAGSAIAGEAAQTGAGRYRVTGGASTDTATNSGTIQAAEVELRAHAGNVYALAVGTGNTIEATGISERDGSVYLVSDRGQMVAQGAITASNRVETSGHTVDFTGVRIFARDWLVDPFDLTVDAAAAATISANLANTNVTLQTTANGATGPGTVNANGAGDINITAPISWASAKTLTLDAYHSVNVTAPITINGGGLSILTNTGGTGGGLNFGLSAAGFAGGVSYVNNPNNALTINGTPYTLLYNMTGLASSLGQSPSGNFALAASIDASGTSYTTSPVTAIFSGTLEGLGNSISNLTTNSTTFGQGALFIQLAAGHVVENLGLTGASVTGGNGVGILSGYSDGGVVNAVYTTGNVSGSDQVGGLFGYTTDTVSNSFSRANVTATTQVGGLIGVAQNATVSSSYATGSVQGSPSVIGDRIGGLIGDAGSTAITSSHASGSVSGYSSVGGLTGLSDGTITDSYAEGSVSGTLGVGGLTGGGYDKVRRSFATGAVSGNTHVGGLIGYAGDSLNGNFPEIYDSYATGPVSQVLAGNSPGKNVGGLIGILYSVSGRDVVSNSTASGAVYFQNGASNVGGLVGYVTGSSVSNSSSSGSLFEISNSLTGRSANLGGLVGLTDPNFATVSNSFYDVDAVTLRGTHAVTPYALYDTQFQAWKANNLTLTASNYFAQDASGNYLINNQTDMKNVLGFVSVAGLKFKLSTDIDLSVAPGFYIPNFDGALFDGGSHHIRNLSVDLPNYYIGLFGQLKSGTITNLAVDGVVTGQNAGGLVGTNIGGTLQNVFANVVVTGANGVNDLIGSVGPIGGLVGENRGTILDAYATGKVDLGLSGLDGPIGGLVGLNSGTIANAYATGWISKQNSTQVGGATGSNSGGLTNVVYDGSTTGQPLGAQADGSIGLGTVALQGTNPFAGSNAWATGTGLYPYLSSFWSGTPQALAGYATIDGRSNGSGSFPIGATIGFYANGAALGIPVTSGGNGYFYELEPGGTLSPTTNVGVTIQLPGETFVSGLRYAGSALQASQAVTPGTNAAQLDISSGEIWQTTSTRSNLSALNSDVASTFGNSLAGISSAISGLDQYFTYVESSNTAGLNLDVPVTTNQGYYAIATTGDVSVTAPFTYSGTQSGINLEFDAFHSVVLYAPVLSTSTGPVVITTAGRNIGGFNNNGGEFLTSAGIPKYLGSLTFTAAPNSGQSLAINGSNYTLLYSMSDIRTQIEANPAGHFALATPMDATGTPFTDAVARTTLTGNLEGLGQTISNLSINSSAATPVGLVSQIGATGTMANLGLTGAAISGGSNLGAFAGASAGYMNTLVLSGSTITAAPGSANVGGIAGSVTASGQIVRSAAFGTLNAGAGSHEVGGLVGLDTGALFYNYTGVLVSAAGAATNIGGYVGQVGAGGTIYGGFALGQVTGGINSRSLGGLVGSNGGSISNTYATGAVMGGAGSTAIGGLVGSQVANASLQSSYAIGYVLGGTSVGGLVGANSGTITSGYFDSETSGVAGGLQSDGSIGLTTAALKAQLPAGFSSAVWGTSGLIYPRLLPYGATTAQKTITGTVTDTTGAPVAGAQVSTFLNGNLVLASSGANGVFYYDPALTFALASSPSEGGIFVSAPSGQIGTETYSSLTYSNGSLVGLDAVVGQNIFRTAANSLSGYQLENQAIFGSYYNSRNVYDLVPTVISAQSATGFMVDQSLAAAKPLKLVNTLGGISIAAGSALSSTATGDAITVVANGNVSNGAGAGALVTPNGRWLIYTEATNSGGAAAPGNAFGGLAGTSYYGDNFNFAAGTFSAVPGGGNRFVFGYQPTLTVSPATTSLVYNGQFQTDTVTVTGLLNGDLPADAVSGAAGITPQRNAGTYSLVATLGSLTSPENYRIALGTGVVTITPASLAATLVGSTTKAYDGNTSATLTPSNFSLTGTFGTDAVTFSTTSTGTYADPSPGSRKIVTATGLTLSGPSSANYTLSSTASGAIGVIDPPVSPVTLGVGASVAYPAFPPAPSAFGASGITSDPSAAAADAAATVAAASVAAGKSGASATAVPSPTQMQLQSEERRRRKQAASPVTQSGNGDAAVTNSVGGSR